MFLMLSDALWEPYSAKKNRGLRPLTPDPGRCPGPRWRLRPQTPTVVRIARQLPRLAHPDPSRDALAQKPTPEQFSTKCHGAV